MADTPLGKGLIEIGANIAPLESGLARAQTRATEYITTIAAGLDTAAPTAFAAAMRPAESSLRNSATSAADIANQIDRATGAIRQFQAAQQQQATQQVKNQRLLIDSSTGKELSTGAGAALDASTKSNTKSIIEETAALNNAAQAQTNYSQKAKQASDVKVGLADRIKGSTKGMRDFASAITGVAGVFTGLLGVFGLVAGAVTLIISKFRENEERAKALREEIASTSVELRSLQNAPVLNLVPDPQEEITAIEKTFDERIKKEIELSDKLMQLEKEKNGFSDAYYQIGQEQKTRVNQLELEKRSAIEEAIRKSDADREFKSRTETQRKLMAIEDANNKLKLQSLDERERIEAEAAMEIARIQGLINVEDKQSIIDAYNMQIGLIEDVKRKNLKRLEDESKKEEQEKQRSLESQARAQAQLAEAQREQFAGLQSQINSLFNTGSMEVGINRVAGLVQVLIDKTERR